MAAPFLYGENMKHTVKNLINSPYDVITVDGPERIPARGELTAEFDERSLAIMRQMGYFQIIEADPVRVTVKTDHEFDAKVGAATVPVAKRGPGRPKKDAE